MQMARTYFSVWYLGNSQKLLTTNQFLVSTVFFIIMNISFFSVRFDLLSTIAKEGSQIRDMAVMARLVFLFCCALNMGCSNAFQHTFRKLKEIGVLRSIFPGNVISSDYD